MKQIADRYHSDRSFGIGEAVYVKLQPYMQGRPMAEAGEECA